MTYVDFLQDYFDKRKQCEDYRLGQHFINLFIKDSSTPRMCTLWEEKDVLKAEKQIHEIIKILQWDYDDLPKRNIGVK